MSKEVPVALARKVQLRFDPYVYSLEPGYSEPDTRRAFSHAVPLRTIVIYCYDPRAAAIPTALARTWPDEVYPGELVLNASGSKVGSTATIFPGRTPIMAHRASIHRRIEDWRGPADPGRRGPVGPVFVQPASISASCFLKRK